MILTGHPPNDPLAIEPLLNRGGEPVELERATVDLGVRRLQVAHQCIGLYSIDDLRRERPMAGTKADLLQGTLAMLILKSLAAGDLHGYSIARWIEDVTKESLAIGEGSLYPTLRRLEDKQLVKSSWKVSDTGRRIRVYSLTRTGRAHLRNEASSWLELTRAITLVLQAEPSLV